MKKLFVIALLIACVASASGMPRRLRIADIESCKTIDESSIVTCKQKTGASAPEIITELPEGGKTIQYSVSQEGLIKPYGNVGPTMRTFFRDVTWYDNGDVYFHNPMPTLSSNSYIKGHVEGEKVVIDLPQCIGYVDNGQDPPFYVYMNKLTFDWMNEEERIGWYYVKEESSTVEFDIIDGVDLELNIGNEGWDGSMYFGEEAVYSKYLYGLTAGNKVNDVSAWLGYGDGREYYTDLDRNLVKLPDNITTEKWVISSNDQCRLLNVGFDGDDVYVSNLSGQDFANSWVKGTLADGVVTFKSGQYMGILNNCGNQSLTYFMAADQNWVRYDKNDTESEEGDVTKGYWALSPADEIKFNYDSGSRVLAPVEDGVSMAVSTSNAYISYLVKYTAPTIAVQGDFDDNFAPAVPEFVSYTDRFAVEWNIPSTNVNGEYLDTSRMWYNVYFDGIKYEFLTDEYKWIPENMTDVPYEFGDGNWDFVVLNEMHRIYIYMSKISEVGIQSFYRALDGTVYASPLVTENVRGYDNDHEPFPPVSILNEYDESTGMLTMKWDIPSTGDLETRIDPAIMYYTVSVDGKKIEFDINGSTTTDIPYLFRCETCDVDESVHTITCRFDSAPSTVTVQSFFYGDYDWTTGETSVFTSEATTDSVTLKPGSSVGITDAGYAEEFLVNLSGIRVEDPLPGVYVRVRVGYDGSVTTDRVIVK